MNGHREKLIDTQKYINNTIILTKMSLIMGGVFILIYGLRYGIIPEILHTITIFELISYGILLLSLIMFFTFCGAIFSYWLYYLGLKLAINKRNKLPPEKRINYPIRNTNSLFIEDRQSKIIYFSISFSTFFILLIIFSCYALFKNEYEFIEFFIYSFVSGLLFYAFINADYKRHNMKKLSLWSAIIPLVPFTIAGVSANIGPIYLKIIGIKPSTYTTFVMNENASDIIKTVYAIKPQNAQECILNISNKKRWIYPKAYALLSGIGDYTLFSVLIGENTNYVIVKIPNKDLTIIKNIQFTNCSK